MSWKSGAGDARPLNRWAKGGAQAVPLYEGKMVQMFDHRAADVVVNAETCTAPRSPKPSHKWKRPARTDTQSPSIG
jgi:hypothetical protein